MTRRIAGLLCLSWIWTATAIAEDDDPTSFLAVKAGESYSASMERLEQEFAQRRAQLLERYVADLDQAQKEALGKDDLEEARKILALKRSLQEEPEEEPKPAPKRRGFSVVGAFWGEGRDWTNVTELVKRHARAGKLEMEVPYHGHELQRLNWPDPAPNRSKTLIVLFSHNGDTDFAIVESGRRVELPVTQSSEDGTTPGRR